MNITNIELSGLEPNDTKDVPTGESATKTFELIEQQFVAYWALGPP